MSIVRRRQAPRISDSDDNNSSGGVAGSASHESDLPIAALQLGHSADSSPKRAHDLLPQEGQPPMRIQRMQGSRGRSSGESGKSWHEVRRSPRNTRSRMDEGA